MNKTTGWKHSYPSMNHQIVSRRNFLIGTAAFSGLAMFGQLPTDAQTVTPVFTADPFSLGVASGDPLPDGVVLWTRRVPVEVPSTRTPYECPRDSRLSPIRCRSESVTQIWQLPSPVS